MSDSTVSGREYPTYWLCLGLVGLAHLAILWIPALNTLVDYPMHLARAWVLHTYDQTPFFQSVFGRVFNPMPNLAIDLVVPPLMSLLPPIAAGKVFLSLIVLLFSLGCHLLAVSVYGRPTWAVVPASFAVFNSAFLYGFVNSCFSTALFLITFAVWLRLRRGWTVTSWLAATILATATYLAHLSGFVFLGLALAVCWATEWIQKRDGIRVALVDFSVLLPAVAIQLYPWSNKVQAGDVVWGTISKRLLGLVSVFLAYNDALSLCTMGLLLLSLILIWWKGQIALQRLLLSIGAAFLIASFLCPYQLTAGGGEGAGARFVPPGIVFLFLSITVSRRTTGSNVAMWLACGAMLLRLGDIGWSLYQCSSAAERQMAALTKAESESYIYEFFHHPADRHSEKIARANLHLPCYALIFRNSVSSDYYGLRGVQPIYFRDPGWSIQEGGQSFQHLESHPNHVDYVWGCNLEATQRRQLQEEAQFLGAGDTCELWKLRR